MKRVMSESRDQQHVPSARPVQAAPMVELVDDTAVAADLLAYGKATDVSPLIVTQRWTSVVLDLFIACAGFFACLVVTELLARGVPAGEAEGPPPDAWTLLGARGGLSLVALLVIWGLLRKNDQSLASVGLGTRGLLTSPIWGLLAYLTVFGYVLALNLVFTWFWPSAAEAMKETQQHNLAHLPPMGVAMAMVFSLTIAIGEEVLFRGFIVTRLRCLTGSWTASVLISSVVFAALHVTQGWLAVLVILGLSIMLGFWLIWRKNLIVVIIAHMLFDATSLIFLNEVAR
jgi:membrane protease YdiL (CAAX protease family)